MQNAVVKRLFALYFEEGQNIGDPAVLAGLARRLGLSEEEHAAARGPATTHAVLQAHEAVAQVAVLAVPDEIREEEVMACVVPMPGVAADASLAGRLTDYCLERLAYFKAPGWVLFVESLPTTGTQKVQKAQIFPRGEDPRGRPGAVDLRERKKRR